MSEQNARGIVCPKCACGHFDVAHGWMKGPGYRYIRKRQCRNCGWSMHTKETPLVQRDEEQGEPPADVFRTGVKPLRRLGLKPPTE